MLHATEEMKTNITKRLEELVRERKGYARARRRALVRLRQGFDVSWTPLAPGTTCMSDECFVDTNVLTYAHDRSTDPKHESARTVRLMQYDSCRGQTFALMP